MAVAARPPTRSDRLLNRARRAHCSPEQMEMLTRTDLSEREWEERLWLEAWLNATFRKPTGPRRDSGSWRASLEMRLLKAWLDAWLHHANALLTPHNAQGQVELDERGEVIWHNLPAEAEWESALLEEQARAVGEYSVDRLPMPEELKRLFALPHPQGLDRLLGCWGPVGEGGGFSEEWQAGLAGLTEQEAKALRYELNGYKHSEEIRNLMERVRRGGIPTLKITTVDWYRSTAKAKLRRLFGVKSRNGQVDGSREDVAPPIGPDSADRAENGPSDPPSRPGSPERPPASPSPADPESPKKAHHSPSAP